MDLIGAVCSGARLDGVLRTKVRRDGANATARIAESIEHSRFCEHLQLLLLQGIAVAGFNVVDIDALNERLKLPVVVRKRPDMAAIRRALTEAVPGGGRKWRLIAGAGTPRSCAGVWLQVAGIPLAQAAETVARFAIHSRIPEPLRIAHVIAGRISDLGTRQRV